MYRVLIIDNEPVIVDGLYDLFQDLEHVELGVLKAYSASEGLALLGQHTIDIVFADIQMPGMNGLELQQTINRNWPRCKVIFLTGYNEFSYVQTAMRNGGFDYVLKTEGDERILEALDTAIASIQEFMEKDRLIKEAREEWNKAKPVLQKEYLISLLDGGSPVNDTIQQKFDELGLTIRTDLPVLLVIGRIDEWPDPFTPSDRLLFLFAIHNIAQEYLPHCSVYYVSFDRNKFVWFIQNMAVRVTEWEAFVQSIHESLDSIQSTCKNMLRTTISFVTHRKICMWNDISSVFNDLRRLLGRGLGLGNEILLTDTPAQSAAPFPETAVNDHAVQNHRTKVILLESYLESGAHREFASLCHSMLQSAAVSPYSYMETYYSIATMILSYLNQMEITRLLLERHQVDGLMRIEEHESWEAAARYFGNVAYVLAERSQNEKKEKSNAIVNRLQQYVHERLDDDLSLNKLAEVVYLNPSYLSRLYKQMTGHGLAEYIAEQRIDKATALLAQTSLKIHEIARQVGLEPGYFIKMFKKYVHMTPQDYRETVS